MTLIKLTNNTSEDVNTHITLGATEGCVQDVTTLVFSDPSITVISEYPLKGYFVHKANTSVYVAAPDEMGFNGNVSFNTEPKNCKSHELPWGMNVAEFIVNNPFQAPYGQETVDISCLAGANALIKFKMDATDWTTNGGAITSIQEIVNGMWDQNTGLIGVFPYGCDNCTSSNNPPACVGLQPQFAQAEAICNVQRPCDDNQGGVVEVILEGFFEIL